MPEPAPTPTTASGLEPRPTSVGSARAAELRSELAAPIVDPTPSNEVHSADRTSAPDAADPDGEKVFGATEAILTLEKVLKDTTDPTVKSEVEKTIKALRGDGESASGTGEKAPEDRVVSEADREKATQLKKEVSDLNIHSMRGEVAPEDAQKIVESLRAQEAVAKGDPTTKIEVTPFQLNAAREHLIGERAIARSRKEDVTALTAEIDRYKRYERKAETQEQKAESTAGQPTVDNLVEIKVDGKLVNEDPPQDRPIPSPPSRPGRPTPPIDPTPDPGVDDEPGDDEEPAVVPPATGGGAGGGGGGAGGGGGEPPWPGAVPMPIPGPGEIPVPGEPRERQPLPPYPDYPPAGEDGTERAGSEYERITGEFELAIQRFVLANVARESMKSSKEAENELTDARSELNRLFQERADAQVAQWAESIQGVQNNRNLAEQYEATSAAHLRDLFALKSLPEDEQPADLDAQLAIFRQHVADMHNYQVEADNALAELARDRDVALAAAEDHMGVKERIETALIAEREHQHPIATKLTKWLKNPYVRMGAGAVLLAAGTIGALHGNVPLVTAAFAGRAALRATGAYNVSRGAGGWLQRRREKRTDFEGGDISTVTGDFVADTGTERKSKQWGLAAGALAAVLPAFLGSHGGPDSFGNRGPSVNAMDHGRLVTNPELAENLRRGMSPDVQARAIADLRGSVSPSVFNKIQAFGWDSPQGRTALFTSKENMPLLGSQTFARFLNG